MLNWLKTLWELSANYFKNIIKQEKEIEINWWFFKKNNKEGWYEISSDVQQKWIVFINKKDIHFYFESYVTDENKTDIIIAATRLIS